MTLAAENPLVDYIEDGVTIKFPIPFTYNAASDVKAVRGANDGSETPLVYGTDYTVSAGFLNVSAPAASGTLLSITRRTARVQPDQYTTTGEFPAKSHEAALDRQMRVAQEQDVDLTRAPKLPLGEVGFTFPTAADRAGKGLFFDGAGAPSLISPDDYAAPAAAEASDAAVSAAIAEGFAGPNYASTAEGLAATGDGQAFAVDNGDDTVTIYRNIAGSAVAQRTLPTRGATRTVPDRTALAAVDGAVWPVVNLNEGVPALYGRMGRFVWNSSDLSAEVTADPLQGVYVAPASDATGASGAWVRDWDGTHGKPEWFGAIVGPNTVAARSANNAALPACVNLCRVVELAADDYFIGSTWVIPNSYRRIVGARGSAEGAGGMRIILSGIAAATDAVIRVGNQEHTVPANCSRRLDLFGINVVRDGVATPAASNRREDGAAGFDIDGWYEGEMRQCFSYGSPVGYRIKATVGCRMHDCGGVRPDAGAATGDLDFMTAFAIGGLAKYFGFIGANASLKLVDCTWAGGVGEAPTGIYLFGYIGDTWIHGFECSQVDNGIYVTGEDGAGNTITDLDAHQDVQIVDCIVDNISSQAITVTHLNSGCEIQIRGNYASQNAVGPALLIENVDGLCSVIGGDIIGNHLLSIQGIKVVNSSQTYVEGVNVKDCTIGVQAINSSGLRLSANIRRSYAGGDAAVDLQDVTRSSVCCSVGGGVSFWGMGVRCDAACGYNNVDPTMIDFASFSTATAAYKVRYNGADARSGFGTNVLSGVTS